MLYIVSKRHLAPPKCGLQGNTAAVTAFKRLIRRYLPLLPTSASRNMKQQPFEPSGGGSAHARREPLLSASSISLLASLPGYSLKRMKRPLHILALYMLVICFCSSCAVSSKKFRALPLSGTLSAGQEAPLYEMFPKSQGWGRGLVWSNGAYVATMQDRKQAVVHAGLELRNESGEEIALDTAETSVTLETRDRNTVEQRALAFPVENTTVAPHSSRSFDLVFLLPPPLAVSDVRAYALVWSVKKGGETYSQTTAFREEIERFDYCYPYDPLFFDPFWGGPYYAPYVYRYRYSPWY